MNNIDPNKVRDLFHEKLTADIVCSSCGKPIPKKDANILDGKEVCDNCYW